MTLLRKLIASMILFIWFLLGIYFGTAGLIFEEQSRGYNSVVDFSQQVSVMNATESDTYVQKYVYDGITFSDKKTVKEYIATEKVYHIFAWLDDVPNFLTLILTSCALGAFGGVISVIRMITHNKMPVEDTQYISIPFLGLLLGMVVLGASYILPTLLTVNKNIQISHTSLVFFSLFVGLFSKPFLTWLDRRFETIINEEK